MFLGTHAENMADAAKKGMLRRGEQHGMAKLTEDQVREIRRLHQSGSRIVDLATQFSISREMIRRILNGRSWSHVV
jgi:DNA invertase Pin-like site-specific DNA recombinase